MPTIEEIHELLKSGEYLEGLDLPGKAVARADGHRRHRAAQLGPVRADVLNVAAGIPARADHGVTQHP